MAEGIEKIERIGRTKQGRVVSDRMDKTVVVAVESYRSHPIYKKATKRMRKFKAHDEANTCHVGDMVRIEEARPLSKEKSWQVAEILSRGSEV
ncbi:30S ribosomal protein S17 [Chloroflexota bacterium]